MEAISYGYSSISEIDNSIKNKWEEDYNLLPQTVKKGQHKVTFLTAWEPPERAAFLFSDVSPSGLKNSLVVLKLPVEHNNNSYGTAKKNNIIEYGRTKY